jgi:hypothetical protein
MGIGHPRGRGYPRHRGVPPQPQSEEAPCQCTDAHLRLVRRERRGKLKCEDVEGIANELRPPPVHYRIDTTRIFFSSRRP